MKVAVVGSRNLIVNDLEKYLPEGTTEIVSGGARGVDSCAKAYALKSNLKYTEFLPDYASGQRSAPIIRNNLIIDYADMVLAFWDGESRGTKYVIDRCRKLGKKVDILMKK